MKLVKQVIVVPQLIDMHKPLHGAWQLHIEAPVCHAGNNAVKLLSDELFHVLDFLHLVGLTLRLIRSSLKSRSFNRHLGKNLLVMGNPPVVQLPAQAFLDNPVNLQIRIPSDGRRKMRVVFGRQTKVAGIQGRIFCLLHGTERQAADQRFFGCIFHLVKQLLYFLGMHFAIRHTEYISEIVDESAQLFHLFLIGLIVGSVKERHFLPEIVLGYRLIGQKHEIFNQAGGRIALIRLDFYGMALLIQDNLALREVKINGTAAVAPVPQNIGQLLHQAKHPDKFPVLFHRLRIAVRDNGVNGRIGHTPVYTDYSLRHLVSDYHALIVDFHQTAQSQTVLPLVQGTDAVGKLMRQHRDDAVRQVNTRPPLEGLRVERSMFFYIMADIGNMDSQFIPIFLLYESNRIVQILCLLTVDCDGF